MTWSLMRLVMKALWNMTRAGPGPLKKHKLSVEHTLSMETWRKWQAGIKVFVQQQVRLTCLE